VEKLTVNGMIERYGPYQTQYIGISLQKLDGVFPSTSVNQLFKVLAEIRRSAVA
jgi:hypothetical protein